MSSKPSKTVSASPLQGKRNIAPKGNKNAPPASKGRHAALSIERDDDLSLPQGGKAAPPANMGQHDDLSSPQGGKAAPPAKLGRYDDLSSLQGGKAAPPANLGRYATAATTACDDDVAARSEDFDLLRAIHLTLNFDERRKTFPRRIEEIEPSKESGRRRFAFSQTYLGHLARIMKRSSQTLNHFLRATGNRSLFSYGTSKYYDGHTFEDILLRDWPVQTIPWNVERRLLIRIQVALQALNCIMFNPDEMPSDSPCPLTVDSSLEEDNLWASEVAASVRAAHELIAKKERHASQAPAPPAKVALCRSPLQQSEPDPTLASAREDTATYSHDHKRSMPGDSLSNGLINDATTVYPSNDMSSKPSVPPNAPIQVAQKTDVSTPSSSPPISAKDRSATTTGRHPARLSPADLPLHDPDKALATSYKKPKMLPSTVLSTAPEAETPSGTCNASITGDDSDPSVQDAIDVIRNTGYHPLHLQRPMPACPATDPGRTTSPPMQLPVQSSAPATPMQNSPSPMPASQLMSSSIENSTIGRAGNNAASSPSTQSLTRSSAPTMLAQSSPSSTPPATHEASTSRLVHKAVKRSRDYKGLTPIDPAAKLDPNTPDCICDAASAPSGCKATAPYCVCNAMKAGLESEGDATAPRGVCEVSSVNRRHTSTCDSDNDSTSSDHPCTRRTSALMGLRSRVTLLDSANQGNVHWRVQPSSLQLRSNCATEPRVGVQKPADPQDTRNKAPQGLRHSTGNDARKAQVLLPQLLIHKPSDEGCSGSPPLRRQSNSAASAQSSDLTGVWKSNPATCSSAQDTPEASREGEDGPPSINVIASTPSQEENLELLYSSRKMVQPLRDPDSFLITQRCYVDVQSIPQLTRHPSPQQHPKDSDEFLLEHQEALTDSRHSRNHIIAQHLSPQDCNTEGSQSHRKDLRVLESAAALQLLHNLDSGLATRVSAQQRDDQLPGLRVPDPSDQLCPKDRDKLLPDCQEVLISARRSWTRDTAQPSRSPNLELTKERQPNCKLRNLFLSSPFQLDPTATLSVRGDSTNSGTFDLPTLLTADSREIPPQAIRNSRHTHGSPILPIIGANELGMDSNHLDHMKPSTPRSCHALAVRIFIPQGPAVKMHPEVKTSLLANDAHRQHQRAEIKPLSTGSQYLNLGSVTFASDAEASPSHDRTQQSL